MDKEKKKKKKIVWLLLSCLSVVVVGLTIAYFNEQAKLKEQERIVQSQKESESLSREQFWSEVESRSAVKKAEEEAAVARARESFERLKAEAQTQQTTQTPVQTQTTNVAQADEQPRPTQNTQTQPARQQTQTPVQTTQAPAPVETYNVGGVNLAGRSIVAPNWILEQLVAEGLGERNPDGTYGAVKGKLLAFSNRKTELMKQAGLLP